MFRKLTLLALLLVFLVGVLAAYVRVASAGLGCPEWPGCYGQLLVDEHLQAMRHAVDAKTRAYAPPWASSAHRYLGGAVGVCMLLLLGLVWRLPEHRARAAGLVFAGALLVAALAGLGYWSVRTGAPPGLVTAQFALGFLTLAVLYALYLEAVPGGVRSVPGGRGIRWLARLGLGVLLVEIVLGGWTSVNYAGTACPDFPTCFGSAWPEVDYATAFDARLFLTPESPSGVLPPDARAAIHWAHRVGAGLGFVLLTLLAIGVSAARYPVPMRRAGVMVNGLLFAGIAFGIAAVLLRLPVAIVVGHHAVAALLLLNVVYVTVHLRRSEVPLAIKPRAEIPPVTGPALPPIVTEPVPTVPSAEAAARPAAGMFERLRTQLGKTRGGLTGVLANLALGKKTIDRELLEEIEERLLMADLGVNATARIIDDLIQSLERHELRDWDVLQASLRKHLHGILRPCSVPLHIPPGVRPFVILVVGVNGVGKTTTIGKLAKRLQNQGHSVMLAAGDTFRAAAVEQLQQWGERNRISVIAQQSGADSASVIYDGVQAAQARKVDVLIADTAGRLHTKSNLMEELRKIKRIIGKLDPTAPHEILLVVDAGTGQNAISQAKQFNEAVGLTGIALTKLDGTAKGGVIFALAGQFGIPIRYIGIGEGIDDLQDFDADKFIEALFETRVH